MQSGAVLGSNRRFDETWQYSLRRRIGKRYEGSEGRYARLEMTRCEKLSCTALMGAPVVLQPRVLAEVCTDMSLGVETLK